MKSLLNIWCAVLLMAASSTAATINQQVLTYFTDAGGNTGFVFVTRGTDPSGVTTTNLYYSFCVQTTAASCLEGNGVVPNNTLIGALDGNARKAEVIKVLADTTIAGFNNSICSGPIDYGSGCLSGTSPATGGLISLTFTTEPGYVETTTFSDQKLENFQATINYVETTIQGPASTQGTVIGTNVTNQNGATWGVGQLSTPNVKKALVKMTPQARNRLERLQGNLPNPAGTRATVRQR